MISVSGVSVAITDSKSERKKKSCPSSQLKLFVTEFTESWLRKAFYKYGFMYTPSINCIEDREYSW